MMRLRVGAQGFTVISLLCGVMYSAQKKKQTLNAQENSNQ